MNKKISIVCCLHGNERYGLDVIERFSDRISCFVGNPLAAEKNARFLDSDMNRVFPGREDGNYEERKAFELIEKLKDYDYVIDLHSTPNPCPLFGIITKPTKEKIEFAKDLGLDKLVIVSDDYASGRALIDFVRCGISIEIGPSESEEIAEKVIEKLEKLSDKKETYPEVFEVFDIVKQEYEKIMIGNFEEVKKGQIITKDKRETQTAKKDFIAILVSEKPYNNVLCLAARKVNLKDIKFYY